MNWKTRLFKYAFFACLFLSFYMVFVFFVVPFFAHPRLARFDQFNRLENWDLTNHGRGDFDGDGKEDFISFTGCAFLSAAQESQIPPEKQCSADGMSSFVFKDTPEKFGQKYIDVEQRDLDGMYHTEIFFSYMGKYNDQPWKIYVNRGGWKIFEIGKDGILKEQTNVPFMHRADGWLYAFSAIFVFLAFPLQPLLRIISLIPLPKIVLASDSVLYVYIAELLSLSVIFFYLWMFGRKHFK